jgi:Uma2 family endonuclease
MVYRKPSVKVYQDVQCLQRGQSLFPEAFPDLILAVEDVLGQP